MFDVTGRRSTLKRLALVGALALSAAGASTTAQALPISPIDQAANQFQTVQYYGHGYRHHRRHGYRGRAGVYSCAPGQVNTHLSRKACGGAKFPRRF